MFNTLSFDTPLVIHFFIREKLLAIMLIHVLPANKGVAQNVFVRSIQEDGKVFSQSNTT